MYAVLHSLSRRTCFKSRQLAYRVQSSIGGMTSELFAYDELSELQIHSETFTRLGLHANTLAPFFAHSHCLILIAQTGHISLSQI